MMTNEKFCPCCEKNGRTTWTKCEVENTNFMSVLNKDEPLQVAKSDTPWRFRAVKGTRYDEQTEKFFVTKEECLAYANDLNFHGTQITIKYDL